MGLLRSGMGMFNLLREINLGQIRHEADQPFTLRVLGDGGRALRLAEALSAAPGKAGVHPWLRVEPLADAAAAASLAGPATGEGFCVALLCLDGLEPDAAARAAQSRLRAVGVPVLTVAEDAEAATRVGAGVPRADNRVRVAVPPGLAPAPLVARVAPALLPLLPPDDGTRVALARQLPALRSAVIASLTDATARANAVYAATTGLAEWVPVLNVPLNAADVVVLTKNQLIMAYKIALAAGKQGQPRDVVGEIVSVIGGGLLFRQVARELIGLIPVIGIVPKVAVAFAGTRVIGAVVERWALEGRRIEADEVRALLTEAKAGARELAEAIVERARGRGGDGPDHPPAPPALPPPSDEPGEPV